MLFGRVFPACIAICLCSTAVSGFADETVRSRAVVDLSFDEPTGDALDAAKAGRVKDKGQFIRGAQRVPSPFWNQKNKQALRLDANAKQAVRIPDSADVDCENGATFSLFFINLHPTADKLFRGLVAKRKADGHTNYGINFQMSGDNFQVYINDGSGYKVAQFSVKKDVGYRRMLHLSAVFSFGDAPAPDADTDKDDLVIRLFINGQLAKVKNATHGGEYWVTDLDRKKLLNDTPVTIGESFADNELSSGLFDEFLIFQEGLSAADAAKLFLEVAGSNGPEFAKQELAAAPPKPAPVIQTIMPRGLQIGQTTRLTVTGNNLTSAKPALPLKGITTNIVAGSKPNRLLLDVTVPPTADAAFVPLQVYNNVGISKPVLIAIDRLPQRNISEVSAAKPVQLPAAVSGTIAGSAQPRVYFRGKKGQRLVAEVECKRLGGTLDPVLELKTDRGAPLKIEWKQAQLSGDTRCELNLPADGLYYAELHDLAYKARGNSPFRIKIGDLKLVDAFLPPALGPGQAFALRTIGTGLPGDHRIHSKSSSDHNASDTGKQLNDVHGPVPVVLNSPATEYVETPTEDGKPLEIDATFPEPHLMVAINGLISKPREQDAFRLNVTGGQALHFALQGRSIRSPIDGVLSISIDGKVRTTQSERGNSRDPSFDFTIPKGAKQIDVSVKDFTNRGSASHFYRVTVSRKDRADFELAVADSSVAMPANGSVPIRIQLKRNGPNFRYHGPIRLSIADTARVKIIPSELPADSRDRTFFAMLVSKPDAAETNNAKKSTEPELQFLQIVGESVGLPKNAQRVARVELTAGNTTTAGQFLLPTSQGRPVTASMYLTDIPPALFKGVPTKLGIGSLALTDDSQTVRLSLQTTETPRSLGGNKGNRPMIRLARDTFLENGEQEVALPIAVPFDVAEPSLSMIVKGELVDHPYTVRVTDTIYSAPLEIPVRNAVVVKFDPPSLKMKPEATGKLTGHIKRAAGFNGPVEVTVTGLPKGYSATKVTIPSSESGFKIPVMIPKEPKPKTLAKVVLRTTYPGAGVIAADQPLAIQVVP